MLGYKCNLCASLVQKIVFKMPRSNDTLKPKCSRQKKSMAQNKFDLLFSACIMQKMCLCSKRSKGGWANLNPHSHPMAAFRKVGQMRRVRPGAHLYSLQKDSLLSLYQSSHHLSPSLCHILPHAREETLTNQKTDRFNFFCINKR